MAIPVLAAPERLDVARRVGDPRVPLDPAAASNLLAKLTPGEIERAEPDIDYLTIMTTKKLRDSAELFDRCVGSLGVLGYGRAWLAKVLQVDERLLAPGAKERKVDPRLMHRVLTAAIRIGCRWATPGGTGQTPEQIRAVHEQAVDRGFRVPAAYSNLYKVEAGMSLPDEAAEPAGGRSKEELISAKIKAVAHFCEHGGTVGGVGRLFGLSGRTVGRTRRDDLGIEVVVTAQNYTGVAPGQEDIVAEVRAAAGAIAIGENPRVAWSRLYASALARKGRIAARDAAGASAAHWAEQIDAGKDQAA